MSEKSMTFSKLANTAVSDRSPKAWMAYEREVRPEAQRVNLYPFPSVARNVTTCP